MISGHIYQENHNIANDKFTIMVDNTQYGSIEMTYKGLTVNTYIKPYKIVPSHAKAFEINSRTFEIIDISGTHCGTIKLSKEYDIDIDFNNEHRFIHCVGQGDDGTYFPQYTMDLSQRGVSVHLPVRVMHRDEYKVFALDYPDFLIQILSTAVIEKYKYTDIELLPDVQYETETLYPSGKCEISRYSLRGSVEHISCALAFGVRKKNKKKFELFNPNWML